MKGKRILLSAIFMIVIAILLFSTNVYAINLSVNDLKISDYYYTLNSGDTTKYFFKITDTGGSNNSSFYCLKGGAGFGSSEGEISDVNYDGTEDVDSLDLSPENKEAVLWLMDNVYLPGQDSTDVLESLLHRSGALGTGENIANSKLAKNLDLIEIIQQCAFWYFTNPDPDDGYHIDDIGIIKINNGFEQVSNLPSYEEGQKVYDYLITAAKNSPKKDLNISITPEDNLTIKKKNNCLILGPIDIIKEGTNGYLEVADIKITDQNNNNLTFSVVDSTDFRGDTITSKIKEALALGDMSISSSLDWNNDNKGKGRTNFFLSVQPGPMASPMGYTVDDIEDINISIEYKTQTSANVLWASSSSAPGKQQPVVQVDRKLKTLSTTASLKVPEFDLSLRKYITKVIRDGVQISMSELTQLNGRTPNIDISNLKTSTNGKTEETAIYRHRKDPVPVETGDIVEYVIEIYNEGDVAGRATKVVDYLPDGLVLYRVVSGNYTYVASESTTSKIVLAKDNNDNLPAFNGTTLSSEKITLQCQVTRSVSNGSAVLTNYAEIAQASSEFDYNENVDSKFADRDSKPSYPTPPTATELPGYKGKDNKDVLPADRNNYYKGQEDDDDFEKLIVSTPQFDLALRKYITKVTRKGVVQNIDELGGRIPNINKNTLLNGSTTADYKHRKDPVPVETGDLVEYVIEIYNEGDIDGRATKIVDHLPDGLIYSSGDATNYNFEVSSDKRTITITPKNGYKRNLAGFDGVTLSSEKITLVCEVTKKQDKTIAGDTILTNIAEIKEAYNYRDEKMYLEGDDRDSEPGNVNLPSDANLPDYKGNASNKSTLNDSTYFYRGQQDDDDFEKLKVLTPTFDLALRKFVTHIDGEAVVESREPRYDTAPLKNKTGTTAIYTHSKAPLTVRIGGTVRYTIRVYNEGVVDGCADIIEDYLPAELEFIPASQSAINAQYGWSATGRTITTTYLSGKTISAYNGGDTLDYKDVQIECKVKDTSTYGAILTNIAQINADTGDDIDSEPGNVIKPSDTNLPDYRDNQQDDDDYEKVVIYKPGFDLALRKFITKINNETVTPSRAPSVDTTKLKNESATTATYTHPKNPLTVNEGDKITYTIRVYNEGDSDGIARVIEDYLPAELEFVPTSESEINAQYRWVASGRIITTTYLSDTVIKAYDGGNSLDYKDVQIECRVKEGSEAGKILTNIAQINGANKDDDRDSTPNNVRKPSDTNLPNYSEHQEDDDDYEKVKIYQPPYDLALRKFITQINNENITSRIPVVDVKDLKNGTSTTATYTHPKNPLVVKNGDIVVYTIRVYNEGKVDGYAEEIKDNIPEGLEFVITNEINAEYMWSLSQDQKTVSTRYLSKDMEIRNGANCIKAFDAATMNDLDYRDVKIAFKVVEPNTSTRVLTNIAEIKEDDGQDIDSTPNNDKRDEDDIDIENVELRYFDLALRKFITKVESKTGENIPVETDTTKDVSREPRVEIDSNGNIKYVHPKDPVVVSNTDIVIYTLRVYNEGTIDGYAEEVKDNIPDGLEFVLDHEINTKYGWVMYEADGKVTNDVTKAKTIRTTYLSQEKDENNMLKQFDRDTMTTPDYKDVQVAFRVVEKNVGEDRVIINMAEISKDSDNDEDSTPDNDNPDEDDLDKEYVKVKYFDLSLLKWVSKVSVTRNGKTEVLETGYNGLENPDPVVKTEIKSSEIKTVVVKYEYGIRVTNEGQIPGYAKEITDYVPGGLEFIPADNPLWTVKDDGRIATRQLENTLLQPGESAVVKVVFKWINSENNFGIKENVAEISEDYNEKDSKDIDSTPDNKVPGEDDIDNALVILNPKTGAAIVFIVLPTIVLAILSTGIVLIKKYVM